MDWGKLPFGTRQERLAFNEAACRELNERKAQWIDHGLPTAGFRCECGTTHCGSRFWLSQEHWEEARAQSDRFVVAPEHVAPDVEVVVKEYSEFWLVEKRGEAEKIAEAME